MAYCESLAERVREVLADRLEVVEKRMFGGVAFLVQGNMACGIHRDDLIVRVGSEQYAEALGQAGVREFDITGRPMNGWVVVGAEACETPSDLREWVCHGLDHALSLPPK